MAAHDGNRRCPERQAAGSTPGNGDSIDWGTEMGKAWLQQTQIGCGLIGHAVAVSAEGCCCGGGGGGAYCFQNFPFIIVFSAA